MKKTVSYYYALDKEKSRDIISDIVVRGRVAASTAYMWMTGQRTPLYLYKRLIQQMIKKHYGELVPLSELFPNVFER